MHEDSTVDTQGGAAGISRRDMLRKSAVVGGAGALMWAAPSITTYGARAFAGTPDANLCPDGEGSGQPRSLQWEYLGGGCGDSDHDQEGQGDFFCRGEAPNGASRVEVRAHREGGLYKTLTDVAVGDTFFMPGEGLQAGARQLFEVYDNGDLVHEVQMHTSCSAPLRIGDRFGAFRLIGGEAS